MGPNDPSINRKYNYIYRITNNINNMEYIGVHRTENLDDGYMGSGKVMKRALEKYGKKHFTKDILEFFDTYKEALAREKEMVTESYINRPNNYNIREGGFGNCSWSEEWKQEFSRYKKDKWDNDPEHRSKMMKALQSEERRKNISKALTGRSRDNPQNKDPEKIRKTAEAHRGMERSDKAKRNMSEAALNASADVKLKRSGIGNVYIYNTVTGEVRRVEKNDRLPLGWVFGSGPKNSTRYKDMNKGSFFCHDPKTKQIKRIQKGRAMPERWVKGRPSKEK